MKKLLRVSYLFLTLLTFFTGINVMAVTHTITVTNSSFSPQFLTINEGDQVIFQLGSGTTINHPIISDNSHFAKITWTTLEESSSAISFPSAGSFGYHCENHGSPGANMYGTITVNAPTSVKDAKEQYHLQASPNPFEDEITLTINKGSKNLTAIRVFDLIGKEVAHIDLKNKSGLISYRLDFSKLNPGVYFCNVYSDAGIVETKKLFRTK